SDCLLAVMSGRLKPELKPPVALAHHKPGSRSKCASNIQLGAAKWTGEGAQRASVGGHLRRSAYVLHEQHDEFRRFGLARVPPNDVDIIWAFVEGLTRYENCFRSASYLHHDRAFQHIHKRMCIVAMCWVRTARRILHREHQTFFAR